MDIGRGTETTLVFLLVRDDGVTPAEGEFPYVRISAAGGDFVEAAGKAREIGSGWYAITLTADETGQLGPLIVVADAPRTAEWRDIHTVVAPDAGIDLDALVAQVTAVVGGQMEETARAAGAEAARTAIGAASVVIRLEA